MDEEERSVKTQWKKKKKKKKKRECPQGISIGSIMQTG